MITIDTINVKTVIETIVVKYSGNYTQGASK